MTILWSAEPGSVRFKRGGRSQASRHVSRGSRWRSTAADLPHACARERFQRGDAAAERFGTKPCNVGPGIVRMHCGEAGGFHTEHVIRQFEIEQTLQSAELVEARQRKLGYAPTGYLTELQKALLGAQAASALARSGYRFVQDYETGISVGLAERLFRRQRTDGILVPFESLDRQASMARISTPGGPDALAALYKVSLEIAESVTGQEEVFNPLRDWPAPIGWSGGNLRAWSASPPRRARLRTAELARARPQARAAGSSARNGVGPCCTAAAIPR